MCAASIPVMKATFEYTGSDNLEVMASAHNYNAYLLGLVLAEIDRSPSPAPRVLDFGAGIGTFAKMVREARPHAVVSCLEPSGAEAEKLRALGFRVLEPDVTDQFDVIYSLNVLEHIEHDAQALATVKDLLAEGGVAVFYVPAFNLLFSNMDRLVEHHRRYRASDFRRLSRAAGLRLVSTRYCDPIGFFAAVVYRLGRGSGQLQPGSVKVFDRFLFPLSAWLERITHRVLGKNVLAIMDAGDGPSRPGGSSGR